MTFEEILPGLKDKKKTALKWLFDCDLFTSASTYGKLFPAAR